MLVLIVAPVAQYWLRIEFIFKSFLFLFYSFKLQLLSLLTEFQCQQVLPLKVQCLIYLFYFLKQPKI